MTDSALLTTARDLWTHLAAAPVSFPEQGISITVAPESRICPPGWTGLVVLGDTGIGTVPDQRTADAIRARLADCAPKRLVDPVDAAEVLAATEMIGPVTLAYLAPTRFRPASGPELEQLPVDHPDLRALENACSAEERAEVSTGQLTSPVFCVRDGADIIAASGYAAWPQKTAHLAILTAPRARGRGLAKAAASRAVEHAFAAGMTPQWRARVPASMRVARSLGFEELGVQIRLRIED